MAVTEQQPKIAQDREQPELTGDTVAMGNHDDLKSVRKVPRYLGWLALFGPGAIYAATAQGSGELVFWPLLIATFGTAFIGLLLPACALQYPVTIEIGRYTTTTGETMFTGFQRVNKFFALLMWIMLFFVYLWFGGYASGAAGGIVALTGFPPGLSADGQTIFWSWGALGATVFFLVAAAFLADTWLALVDAVSRMHADFFTANLKSARNWGFRNVFYLWFGILTLVSLITIPFATPGALLITVAILQFFAMMLYIPGLIYLNYYKIPRTYPHWTRPSNWALAAICISGAFYIVVGIYYLTIKF